jgi:hypothetical protein
MKRQLILLLLPVCALAFNKTQRVFSPLLRPIQAEIRNTFTIPNPIRICALRVAFQPDDDPVTTGDGQFLTSASLPCDNFPIVDPAPHNNTYFKNHLKALANFYRHASRGKVVIDTLQSVVFPLDNSAVYQLPHQMAYYHPFLEKDSIDIRLTELFVEAVHLATEDPDIDFSQYHLVVVFHAGVGQDFELFLDPTPYDIPSAYLNSGDLANYYDAVGLPADYLPVDRGIILPESQNHLFYPNWEDVFGGAEIPCDYQIGLNGTFALMVGYFLGLPGLYDTETGRTGVGKFGLMDQGSANLNGLVPSFPSAWEREFMGWDMPVFANGYQNVKLPYAESGSDTTLWRIPINDNEYFLVENRYNHVRPGVYLDSIQYKIYVDNGEKDWPPLLPLIFDSIGAEFSAAGVFLGVPRYDVGLPGSGLLIWHIDQSVIDANIAQNRVNADRTHRGVDLEEGDGAQDLGYESQLIGANVDNGWYFDPWFAGNEGFWDMNPDYPQDDLRRVGFTDYTNPSARSYDGAFTGIAVDSIGLVGAVMSFLIHDVQSVTGFEITLAEPPKVDRDDIQLLPLNYNTSDTRNELIVKAGWLEGEAFYAYDEFGRDRDRVIQPVLDNPIAFSVSGMNYLLAAGQSESSDSLEIIRYKVDQGGGMDDRPNIMVPGMMVVSNYWLHTGRLYFITKGYRGDKTPDYYIVRLDPVWANVSSVSLIRSIRQIIMVGDRLLADPGEGILIQINPETLEIETVMPDLAQGSQTIGTAYINNDDMMDIVLVYPDAVKLILDPFEDSQTILSVKGDFDSTLAFSDIDGDQRIEIIVKNSTEILAYNEVLILEANFPLSVPNQYIGKSFQQHVLTTDVDGDGIHDIVTTL